MIKLISLFRNSRYYVNPTIIENFSVREVAAKDGEDHTLACADAQLGSNFLWSDGYVTADARRFLCDQSSALGMYINTIQPTAGNVEISFYIPISDYTFRYTTPAGGIDADDLRDELYSLLTQIPQVTDHYIVGKSLVTLSHTHQGTVHNHLWVRLQSKENDTNGEYAFDLLNGVRTTPHSMLQFQTHVQGVLQN